MTKKEVFADIQMLFSSILGKCSAKKPLLLALCVAKFMTARVAPRRTGQSEVSTSTYLLIASRTTMPAPRSKSSSFLTQMKGLKTDWGYTGMPGDSGTLFRNI